MEARAIKFEGFLIEPKTVFRIPVYQRKYDWQKKQCQEFFKDIEQIVNEEKDNHFLGSIVYIKGSDTDNIEDNFKEYIIIDGQQRITTIVLFLKAIHDVMDKSIAMKWEKEDIFKDFLTNKNKDEHNLKLQLIKSDSIVLTNLIHNYSPLDKDSMIIKNYQYFKDLLRKKTDEEIRKYFQSFKRLWIVYIELDREKDDPQLIFESINSTGLSLSQADLIRNFILMDKEPKEQNRLFEDYWFKIENLLDNDKISAFIRDYLTMKTTYIPKKSEVYVDFKAYTFKENKNSEELLSDLLYYAKIYSQFLNPNYNDNRITKVMIEINDLKKTVTYPYFLHLFHEFEEENISVNTLLSSIELIRNYIFRRLICKSNNNIFTSLFANLDKEIKKIFNNNYPDYYKYLASILLNKRGGEIFPRDEEFKSNFMTKDIYNSKDKIYIIYSLESFENKELVPYNDLSIEHIMPQKLTDNWKSDLGDNFKNIHDKYLHIIGNLTLTAYNSNLSNKIFTEKKNILKESNIKLNKYFDNINHWNDTEIEKRTCYIIKNIALNIWEFPNIDESLFIDKNYANYNLSDKFDSKGRKIIKINILNQDLITESWVDSFEKTTQFLFKKDKIIFESFLLDENFIRGNSLTFSSDSSDLRRPIRISNEKNILYVEGNLNSTYIVDCIKLMAKKFELSDNDIVFYLKIE